MENQNIKWETWEEQPQENNAQQQGWGEQPQQEQPQVNWGEQSQEENIPTWGEQPQQEQPQQGWEEQLPQENNSSSWDWSKENIDPLGISTPSDFQNLEINEWEMKTSLLGLLPKLKIESLVYKVDYSNEQVTQDLLNNNLTPVDNDGKYALKPQEGTELNKVLFAIKNIAETRGMKVKHSFVYKNSPNESSINISRGECRYNYLYFSQASFDSGDVVLDLSAINGPSEQLLQASPGLLLLLPGWVPYRITRNKSNQDMIAIGGRLTDI